MMENAIRRETDFEYFVQSQSKEGKEYRVVHTLQGWACTCPDYLYRAWTCKHIFAVQFSFNLREQVKQSLVISPIDSVSECAFCHSQSIKKYGIRRNRSGDIQRYICEYCKRTFSVNIGFERMKHNPQAITTAMQLYFSGESLRNTQKSLKLLGVDVCFKTVYNWIQKYTQLMQKYIDQIQPNLSDVWRADEIYVKVRGNQKYVYALMDDETRYWIAQQVANTKGIHDIRSLFREGIETAGKKPIRLITDGAPNFHEAYNKEIRSMYAPKKTEHIQEIRLAGKVHNNKMERLNGEIRDREKTMRGLKSEETPILKGYQIFHNYIREHEGLKGQTPAEASGIKVEGQNKWITLIQNAKVNSSTEFTQGEKLL
ncbi:MAG: IS6 family transposase [Rhabdochlamydiaceae bacterium]